MQVTVIFISCSSNFASYLEVYLMYKQHIWIMSQYELKFDLKINVDHSDLHFKVH